MPSFTATASYLAVGRKHVAVHLGTSGIPSRDAHHGVWTRDLVRGLPRKHGKIAILFAFPSTRLGKAVPKQIQHRQAVPA
eukprot:361064-Chlamydomonas_euryale.AAC.4